MLDEQGKWGCVQDAQTVTLSLREPHTTPSEAYLSTCLVSVFCCVCVCALGHTGVSDVVFLWLHTSVSDEEAAGRMQCDEQQLATDCFAEDQ